MPDTDSLIRALEDADLVCQRAHAAQRDAYYRMESFREPFNRTGEGREDYLAARAAHEAAVAACHAADAVIIAASEACEAAGMAMDDDGWPIPADEPAPDTQGSLPL